MPGRAATTDRLAAPCKRVACGGPDTWLGGPDMTSKFTELAIDCADPGGLARFWCAVLGSAPHTAEDAR